MPQAVPFSVTPAHTIVEVLATDGHRYRLAVRLTVGDVVDMQAPGPDGTPSIRVQGGLVVDAIARLDPPQPAASPELPPDALAALKKAALRPDEDLTPAELERRKGAIANGAPSCASAQDADELPPTL